MKIKQWISGISLVNFAMLSSTSCFADQAALAPEQGSIIGSMALPAVMILALYFLMIRPQSKRAKEQRELISGVTSGDEVVTTGGIFGKISKVDDNFFMLAVADGVEIKVQKQSVAAALPKGSLKAK